MHLDDVLRGNDALVYMERYVDEGTKTYSPFAAMYFTRSRTLTKGVRGRFVIVASVYAQAPTRASSGRCDSLGRRLPAAAAPVKRICPTRTGSAPESDIPLATRLVVVPFRES